MSAPKAPREAGIELGRIYCCFCVILIHLNAFFPAYPAVSLTWSLAKCASTPVFFLIAGFFFGADKPFALFLCYLCFPLLKMICADNEKSRKLKRYLLWLGGLFFVFRVTLLCIFPDSFTVQHLDWWIEEKPFYWLWLMLVGHELARYFKNPVFLAKWRKILLPSSFLAYVSGGLILYVLTMKFNVDEQGLVNQRYYVREFFFYIFAQMGMFIFFCSLNPGRGLLSRIILFVADKTFYVYIIHEAVYIKLLAVAGYDLTILLNYLTFAVLTFMIALGFGIVFKKTEKTVAGYLKNIMTKKT
jgi:hypothetical protein